mmetsp:Transcript_1421/g.4434  ORF Transcript_1421/g.4434 Transcript_1421/m.4434 type:complete len:209 (+) Transcript_1421:1688-2314(+)
MKRGLVRLLLSPAVQRQRWPEQGSAPRRRAAVADANAERRRGAHDPLPRSGPRDVPLHRRRATTTPPMACTLAESTGVALLLLWFLPWTLPPLKKTKKTKTAKTAKLRSYSNHHGEGRGDDGHYRQGVPSKREDWPRRDCSSACWVVSPRRHRRRRTNESCSSYSFNTHTPRLGLFEPLSLSLSPSLSPSSRFPSPLAFISSLRVWHW